MSGTNKSKFTKETREAIVTSVSIGASLIDACRAARISDQTFYNWTADGKAARTKLESGEKLTPAERARLDFLEEVEAADAQCAIDMQMLVYNSAQSNADDAKWWLERRRPDQFKPVVRNEMTGGDGRPMEIVIRYADVDIA